MENTIMAGSRVIGSRLHYKFSEPERGDVAIFVFGWQCPQCGAIIEGDKQDTCPACGSEVGKRGHTIYYEARDRYAWRRDRYRGRSGLFKRI